MMEGDCLKSKKIPPGPKFILKGEMGLVHCFNFSITDNDNGKFLYVGNEDGEIYVWNLVTKKITLKQKLGSSIQTIHLYNTTVITQEKEGLIKIYKLENNKFTQIYPTITTKGTFCKCVMVDHFLFAAAEEGVDMYNIKTMEKAKSLICDTVKKLGMLMCLTEVSKDSGLYVLALYETGDGILWDTSTFGVVDRMLFKPQPLSVTFNEKKGRGLAVGASNTIQVFEVRDLSIGGTSIVYEVQIPNSSGLSVVKSRKDSLVFVIGGSDGKLRYFSWKTFKLLAVLTEHTRLITEVRFGQDGAMAASSTDGTISFWDLY